MDPLGRAMARGLPLERDMADAFLAVGSCAHKHKRRLCRILPALRSFRLVAADGLLAPFEDLRLQGVALARRWGLRRHAEMYGGQHSPPVVKAHIFEFGALGPYSDHLAAGDLGLLDVVLGADSVGYYAGRRLAGVAEGALQGDLGAGLLLVELLQELVDVFY